MKNTLFVFIGTVLILIGCSSEPKMSSAHISANITVADSLDRTRNYSGIKLMIISPSQTPGRLDTLFSAESDTSGLITGNVEFASQGIYTLVVNRNNTDLAVTQVILSNADTLNITGELPALANNLKIDSRENRAIQTFRRLETGFNRVVTFINAGALEDSAIVEEVYKWSDLFWELHQKEEGTYAGNLSAQESVRLLTDFDDSLMIERVNSMLPSDFGITVATIYGMPYNAQTRGIDGGVKYLDSLSKLTKNEEIKQSIDQIKITALFDSSRVETAIMLVNRFKTKYSSDEDAMLWAESVEYDLNFLAPGIPVPSFSFTDTRGDSLSTESLLGKPYILEISPVVNAQYQSQYDRSIVIKQIYKNYNLEIITIPLDESREIVQSFYNEVSPLGIVAELGSFDVQKLIESFNITRVPTRVLVDKNGVIVRKYVGNEYEDIIKGLNKIVRQNENIGS